MSKLTTIQDLKCVDGPAWQCQICWHVFVCVDSAGHAKVPKKCPRTPWHEEAT